MFSKLRRSLHWAALSSCLLIHQAHGQDIDSSTRGAARALGYSGVQAFQRGDYVTASDKLDKAFKILAVPSLGLWSARALEKLGHLVEAADRYRNVGALKAVGDEDVQRKATEEAAAELRALEPRIPAVVVSVEGTQ